MSDYPGTLLYKLRFLLVGILIIASLFLLSFMLAAMGGGSAGATDTDSYGSVLGLDTAENPNVVAGGIAMAMDEFGQAMDSTARTVNSSVHSIASATAQGGKFIGRGIYTGVTATVRGIGSGLAFTGRTVGRGFGFIFGIPGDVVGFVSNTAVVSSVIRPADNMEVPIIDPDSPELQAAIAALPAAQGTPNASQPAPQDNAGPVWPIHGQVTAGFGVPHRPYQAVHSGIDISDGRPSGVTPVKPFRPGRVIDTIHSRYGFGNHVIVDHGNGVTSLYGHLASISVKVGQDVTLGTTLGTQGTTGMSTGTHLHFEVRVNGQAADPRKFVTGQP